MQIRAAGPDDAAAIATVQVRGWQWGYRGVLPNAFLDALSIPERTTSWRSWIEDGGSMLVAEDQEQSIVGFVSFGPVRDEEAGQSLGEVYAIYVAEAVAGAGFGFQLLRHAENELRTSGCTQATLWTLADSDRARRSYERQGWAADGGMKVERARGGGQDTDLHQVRYRKSLSS